LEQSAHDDTPLEIRTDSKYVVNAANDWSNKWAQDGWTGSNGQPVQNRDLLERIVELKDQRQGSVKFTYVPEHQGYEGNEKADRLATAAAQNR
jgi:ribonuclease HI